MKKLKKVGKKLESWKKFKTVEKVGKKLESLKKFKKS
jgi:hypothetical protein